MGERSKVRIALSIAIVFHLLAVTLAPNKETYAASKLAFLIEPYVDFLELASSWNFFAPDPGPPPVYVEWELFNNRGEPSGEGRWPEAKDPYFWRERQNRKIATARYMVFSDLRTEQILLPYLCRKHPEARSVKLWRTMYQVPGLQAVASGDRKIGDDLGVDRHFVSESFCEGSG